MGRSVRRFPPALRTHGQPQQQADTTLVAADQVTEVRLRGPRREARGMRSETAGKQAIEVILLFQLKTTFLTSAY